MNQSVNLNIHFTYMLGTLCIFFLIYLFQLLDILYTFYYLNNDIKRILQNCKKHFKLLKCTYKSVLLPASYCVLAVCVFKFLIKVLVYKTINFDMKSFLIFFFDVFYTFVSKCLPSHLKNIVCVPYSEKLINRLGVVLIMNNLCRNDILALLSN